MNFDEKKIAKKIALETKNNDRLSLIMAQQLKKITNPELQPYISDWLAGQNRPFEFYGITSDDIIKKQNESYIGAIFFMSVLLDHPEYVDFYKNTPCVRM